ncbi:MAG: substrate-binding domain-containing protein [Planctomycetes bacterium]|nr:substrate-binding domain-containing protein [Planctomycetota bacterium]
MRVMVVLVVALLAVPAVAARPRIAMIPKGTTHVFWKTVESGAREAAAELDVDLVWKGPLKENDRGQQIAIVEQFVTEGVAAIALAPLDATALRRPVALAAARTIPVVIFDSALQGEAGKDFVSLVATDNRRGGELGGARLADALDGRGRVVLLRYQVGSASTDEREAGFAAAVAARPGIEVISDSRYSGATAGEAKTAALNMLDTLKAADGIFCPNESSSFGMLLALRQHNLAGKVKFVGFDTSPALIAALRKGEIDALVAQDPRTMGRQTVTAAVRHLRGEAVEPAIDTGAAVVTRDNVDTPAIQKILQLP